MRKVIFFPLLLLLLSAADVYGQNPVPDPDTLANPVQEGDPAVRNLPPGLDYVDDRQRITAAEVPDAVRQTLESSAQYTDWQKATIYRDKNKDEYLVEYKNRDKTTTYRFNKEGKPVIEQ